MNHKRVYRLHLNDGLSFGLKQLRRNVSAANRGWRPSASVSNEMWSMDFVSDARFDGRRMRALTVVDALTREAMAINVDQGDQGRADGRGDDKDRYVATNAPEHLGRQRT